MNYELSKQEIGFLFRIRHGGQSVLIHTKMKAYDNRVMIALLKDQAGFMKQSVDDFDAWDVKGGSVVAGRDFFDAHVLEVKLSGKALTQDEIVQIDNRWDIKNTTIEHGYNGIFRVVQDPESEKPLELEDLLASPVIHTRMSMTDDFEAEQQVLVDQYFSVPTAMDSIAWERAQIQQGLKQGGFRIQYNHEALNTLFNKMIMSMWNEEGKFGCTIQEAPCVKANKEAWTDKVPYLLKRAGLSFLFAKAERAIRGNV